jgi:PAS domain S-box-containing protein
VEIDAFRKNAPTPLDTDLAKVLSSPAGVTVSRVREGILVDPRSMERQTSMTEWLSASGRRIGALRGLERETRDALASAAAHDQHAIQAAVVREVAFSLAIIVVVASLALALGRSITGPLGQVSEGARTLSSGDLAFDVGYVGHDEIGDVAAAFRGLHRTAEGLAGELRAMNVAVCENRLDHRADVGAFAGTWSSLLAGLNDTMAAFAQLQGQRERAERQVGDFFQLSLDLLCIVGIDGYLKRVNSAFERTLGYTQQELLSKPLLDFVHPDDRRRTREASAGFAGGRELVHFENRFVARDGSVRWLQWSGRPVPGEPLVYATARDVTESRRAAEEQAALRRVATLVASGAAPSETFSLVAAEVGRLFRGDAAVVLRYEHDGSATLVGGWNGRGVDLPIGANQPIAAPGVALRVRETGEPGRAEPLAGGPPSGWAFFRELGAGARVGAPITVEGRLWGVVIAVASEAERLPAGSEAGLGDFTELVATAIANAEARVALRRVADEQAALRRVATLVARSVPPAEVFAAVAAEIRELMGVDITTIARFEPDATATVMAGAGHPGVIGERRKLEAPLASEAVFRTGRSARVDDFRGAWERAREIVDRYGVRSSVASPIVVGGSVWGAIVAASRQGSLPPDTEQRLADFTELVATAIANAEHRSQLAASRARVVAAADETRRRLERDLHDGVQQRLVSLALDLRATEDDVPPEVEQVRAALARAVDGLNDALCELREISRGIHPAILAQGGLSAALRTLGRRSAIPVQVSVDSARRLPQHVEVAAYYVVAEALANVAKHARASAAFVDVAAEDGVLRLCVRDDGVGGADPSRGSGLVGLTDRVEALGGAIAVESAPGKGTSLHVTLPIARA